jgi:uncharacterized protein (TIGR02147 family)
MTDKSARKHDSEGPSVFRYTNYRTFLHDFLQANKGVRSLSHRAILRQMGITSTGFLSNVISGKNNLTTGHIHRLVKILKLKRQEARFFEALVFFTQAGSIEEKNEYFARLKSLQKADIKTLNPEQFSMFAKWHFPVVRELIACFPFRDDFKALAKKVVPRITPKEAQEAVSALEGMGLIRKNEKGFYEQVNAVVSSGDEVTSLHVANFQLSTMDIAKQALGEIRGRERDISVLTLSLSRESFKKMKSEIQAVRKRILKAANEEENPKRVYQCNINFFPVSMDEEK